MDFQGITIIGLGPGDPALLTKQADEMLKKIPEIFLRTRNHPVVAGFPADLRVSSFDHYYEQGATFEEVYERIVDKIITLGQRESGVAYGVPGHPFIAEATSLEIFRRAQEKGIPIKVIEGLSFIESFHGLLRVDPFPQTHLIDALELAISHHPSFPPSAPAVIAQIHSPHIASEVKLTLMNVYPDDHEVKLIHGAGTSSAEVETLPLYAIDRSRKIGLLTALYLPPLDPYTSFEAFQELVVHLRAPDGCPWDRDQTHLSLRPYLLEETYEVLTALDSEDEESLREELGDLLLQVVLHAQIAHEHGEFSMADVLRAIHEKLVRRHPHVFGDLEVKDKQVVLHNWEKLKSAEKHGASENHNGVLDGVSPTLPALVQAQAYQERVSRVGFDWLDIQGVVEKISEELSEVSQAASAEDSEQEIGDLLFSVVNLARWLNIDAESALRSANRKFRHRFETLESTIRSQGRDVSELTVIELNELWDAIKGDQGN